MTAPNDGMVGGAWREEPRAKTAHGAVWSSADLKRAGWHPDVVVCEHAHRDTVHARACASDLLAAERERRAAKAADQEGAAT